MAFSPARFRKFVSVQIRQKMPVEFDSQNTALSRKEQEILKRIADGQTSRQIADAMCLSLPTIKWYRKQLFAKFDAENAADLVRKAMEQNVL